MAKIQQIWQRWIPGLLEKAVKSGETVEWGAKVTKLLKLHSTHYETFAQIKF